VSYNTKCLPEFWGPSSSARWQTQFQNLIIFGVVVVAPMPNLFGHFGIVAIQCASKPFFESELLFSRWCGWKMFQTMRLRIYQSIGIKVHLIRKVVREYRSFKRQFPEDAAKITNFGKDNCQFVQEDVYKKFPQIGIFYLDLTQQSQVIF